MTISSLTARAFRARIFFFDSISCSPPPSPTISTAKKHPTSDKGLTHRNPYPLRRQHAADCRWALIPPLEGRVAHVPLQLRSLLLRHLQFDISDDSSTLPVAPNPLLVSFPPTGAVTQATKKSRTRRIYGLTLTSWSQVHITTQHRNQSPRRRFARYSHCHGSA